MVTGLLLKERPAGVPLVRAAITETLMPSTGAPDSSRRTPAIAAPRHALTTRPVRLSPAAIEIDVPGRPGRLAPYADVMYDARVTVSRSGRCSGLNRGPSRTSHRIRRAEPVSRD